MNPIVRARIILYVDQVYRLRLSFNIEKSEFDGLDFVLWHGSMQRCGDRAMRWALLQLNRLLQQAFKWCCNYSPWNSNQFGFCTWCKSHFSVPKQTCFAAIRRDDHFYFFSPLHVWNKAIDAVLFSVVLWRVCVYVLSPHHCTIERREKCTWCTARTTLLANSHYNL